MDDAVRLLVRELADLSVAERERIFRERPISSELRAEVESLLRFDSTEKGGLTERISRDAAEVLRSTELLEPAACGPYRLLRRIGSGGMGAVYLAERADGEIQQQVAIKLLHPGYERPGWRERPWTAPPPSQSSRCTSPGGPPCRAPGPSAPWSRAETRSPTDM